MEAVRGIKNARALPAAAPCRPSGQYAADGRVAVDDIVLPVVDNLFQGAVCFQVFGAKRRAFKRHIKNLIGKIQLQSVFFGKVIARGYVDDHVLVCFTEHLYKRPVELTDMTLYRRGD